MKIEFKEQRDKKRTVLGVAPGGVFAMKGTVSPVEVFLKTPHYDAVINEISCVNLSTGLVVDMSAKEKVTALEATLVVEGPEL